MKQHLARYLIGAAILVILLGHAAKFYHIGFVSQLDAIIYDTKLHLTMPRGIDERIVVLDIDEKSLTEIGRWPWGRDRVATMIDKLFDTHGIAVLGFDVVFAEPDDSSGLKSLERLAKTDLRDNSQFQSSLKALRPQLDNDARFAASLKNRPVVLGYYMTQKSAGGTSSGALPAPVLPTGTFAGRDIAFTSWDSYGGNRPEFLQAAASAGHFNPVVDFDGISRRVAMLAEFNGAYYEALSLAMIRTLLGFPPVVPGYPEGGDVDGYSAVEWLDLPTPRGTLRIPVDDNVAALIPYRGLQGSFLYVSAADVLADRVPAGKLKGKLVIVGTTAPGLMDLRATPVGGAYAGVEIHANLLAGYLDGNIKYRPTYVMGVDVLLLLAFGGIMIFLLPRLSPLRASLVTLAVLATALGINMGAWTSANMVLPLAATLLLIGLLFAMNMSWGYFVESRTKRQFTDLFGQYVPPELVDEMAKNPQGYSMQGRKAELTVLFSDVRGFTTISEGLQPDELATLMNEYLGSMTEVIRQNRGTLDKYIGDAIMAFWGAPVADADHARHAIVTALAMQAALKELNPTLTAKGWPELKIGVGVNTGNMTVGDMGSPVRKAYTVMGDAVNLGSRLEGITKQYGVGIIVGDGTRELTKNDFVFRELDRVRVKGKAEPVGIYEPVGAVGTVSEEDLDEIKLWNQALRHYRAQEWDQAELALMNLNRIKPRYLYDLYAKRIAHCRQEPPGEGWDGVTTFETK